MLARTANLNVSITVTAAVGGIERARREMVSFRGLGKQFGRYDAVYDLPSNRLTHSGLLISDCFSSTFAVAQGPSRSGGCKNGQVPT